MSDVEKIEREVVADRQTLAHSLDALSASVSPDNVKAHAATLVEQYSGDLGRQTWSSAKQNPAAFALLGTGLALMVSGAGSRPDAQPAPAAAVPPAEALKGFDQRVAAADAAMTKEIAMKQTTTSPRAIWLRERLNDGLDALPASARDRVLTARKAALSAQEKVEDQARKAAQKSQTFMHNQPLAVGALAIGLGALIGALLPSTRREDEVLGQHRDAVMAAARSTLNEELDKAHQAARTSLQG